MLTDFLHEISAEKLDAFYGKGNWKEMPSDSYKRVRYEPASWTVEVHTVHVYVGTGGVHQDEFQRADRPKDLLRNSIVTPSLGAAILNGKFVNSLPLNRISAEFDRNGLLISRQTMSNWVIRFGNYFRPVWERMKYHLLSLSVVQADETPTKVLNDGRPGVRKSYMWVYRNRPADASHPIILFEWQPSRRADHPREFLKDFSGTVVTDGYQVYHTIRLIASYTNP